MSATFAMVKVMVGIRDGFRLANGKGHLSLNILEMRSREHDESCVQGFPSRLRSAARRARSCARTAARSSTATASTAWPRSQRRPTMVRPSVLLALICQP